MCEFSQQMFLLFSFWCDFWNLCIMLKCGRRRRSGWVGGLIVLSFC